MKDLILVESRTARQQKIGNCSVLDKVKILPYLSTDMRSTIQQVATYYEVPEVTVRQILSRNKEEFMEDGIEVLKRRDFKKLSLLQDVTDFGKTPSLALLPKRAVLRVGMLLRESEIARLVRSYLLNLEEVATKEQKEWSLQREIGKLKRSILADAIRDYIPNSPYKVFAYPNFTKLIYKKVFGKTAKELRVERGCKNNDALRDTFTAEELKAVESLEMRVSAHLEIGRNYHEIKAII